MSNSDITIGGAEHCEPSSVFFDWQPAQWKGSQRRYTAGHIKASFEYAHDYISNVLGLSPTTKVVRPYETFRNTSTRAVSMSPEMIEIYFTGDEIKHRKLAAVDKEITGTFVHEMVHGIREVVFPYGAGGIIERIASEGIAYVAQAYTEIDVFDAPHKLTVLNDVVNIADLLEELYNEPHFDTDFNNHPDHNTAMKNWLFDKSDIPYSWGHKLGIMCVRDMVENLGYDFVELIHMPAQEIIAS